MKYDTFFRKNPVFTGEELTQYQSSIGEGGGRVREALLSYHVKSGRILRIRRGLFAVIPAGANPKNHLVDPFLVAGNLTPDAILSHHTALQFYGRSYSLMEQYVYSSAHPLGPLTFQSGIFRGTLFPRALGRAGKQYCNVLSTELAGVEIRVTSLERTLVDVLDRPTLSGSWEEIWRSLESVEFFDLDKVVEYALLLTNATTAAKVGFYLEQHRELLMVEEHHLNALRDRRPQQPHYLDRAKRQSGRLVQAWNLVVPNEVLERAWGEVV